MEVEQSTVEDVERLIMNVLVTGATGFIGSHLVERLVNDKYNVLILKRSTSDDWRIKNILKDVKSYDIDKVDLRAIFKSERIDLIIHLAASQGRKGQSIEDIIESNVIFPSILIDAALKSGLKGFINTDTSATDSYTLYASSKKAFLPLINFFHNEKDLNVINLRLEYVYGPKDDETKFIPYLIKSVLYEKQIDASAGMQKRDFVFVEDVVDAYSRAVDLMEKMNKEYITFNIGSGHSITLRDFANNVHGLTNKKARINWGAIPYRKNDIFNSTADIEKAKELMGWSPKHDIQEGLKKTIGWHIGER